MVEFSSSPFTQHNRQELKGSILLGVTKSRDSDPLFNKIALFFRHFLFVCSATNRTIAQKFTKRTVYVYMCIIYIHIYVPNRVYRNTERLSHTFTYFTKSTTRSRNGGCKRVGEGDYARTRTTIRWDWTNCSQFSRRRI